jgi:hypothetical protein
VVVASNTTPYRRTRGDDAGRDDIRHERRFEIIEDVVRLHATTDQTEGTFFAVRADVPPRELTEHEAQRPRRRAAAGDARPAREGQTLRRKRHKKSTGPRLDGVAKPFPSRSRFRDRVRP